MSLIEIKKVETKKDLKTFIDFHYDLYEGNEYDVPNLFSDDMNTLSKDKNAAFEFCEAEYYLAYKDGKLAGRITQYRDFQAVNYHRWEVCKAAELLGEREKLPVYRFLKEPLIRKFGEEWYKELEIAAVCGRSVRFWSILHIRTRNFRRCLRLLSTAL